MTSGAYVSSTRADWQLMVVTNIDRERKRAEGRRSSSFFLKTVKALAVSVENKTESTDETKSQAE
jgi:hypothetical protein